MCQKESNREKHTHAHRVAVEERGSERLRDDCACSSSMAFSVQQLAANRLIQYTVSDNSVYKRCVHNMGSSCIKLTALFS